MFENCIPGRSTAIGAENERKKWQRVVVKKEVENEKLRIQFADLQAKLNG